jgi:hypothetical protein
MSDSLDDLLGNLDSGAPISGGALRKQLEQVLAANKALEDQLAQVKATQREGALDGLFSKHGIPPLARDFFPKDGELTDEAATDFVAKYGGLWGATAQPATTTPADQAATSAAQAFVSQAQPAPVAPLSEEEYRAKFAEAGTKQEFLRLLSELEVTAAD